MRTRRIITACILLLALAVLLAPQPAHADALDGLSAAGNAVFTIVLRFANAMLDLANRGLIMAIGFAGSLLQQVLSLDPSVGGSVVYTAWKVLRDMCNMAFIIALILMAFGTIFNSLDIGFLKPYSINARGVIVNFLVAAILLNFSLAIGQTVVAASNQVSKLVVVLLPKNMGAQIVQQLKVPAAVGGIRLTTPALPEVSPDTLSPTEQAEIKNWPAAQQQLLLQCLNGELAGSAGPGERLDTPAGCYQAIQKRGPAAPGTVGYLEAFKNSTLGAFWSLNPGLSNSIDVARFFTEAATGAKIPSQLATFTGYIFSIVLLSSLLIDFLTMILFMLVRLPAIWILLALSPIAWTALAFPGMGTFKEWWKQFWAWNLFSPLYLFVLYLGMLLIQNVNVAVASMGAQDSLFISSLGVAFLYLVAAIVFVGGTAMVLKASFLAGTYAGGLVGRITGTLGTGGQYGALAPVGRFLGTTTGATAAYRGAAGGIQAKYEEKVGKPMARRQEEIEARYKERFGDRGAAVALQQKRIKELMKKNEETGLSTVDMKDKLSKAPVGSTEYFALSQALLKEGELDATQMKTLSKSAAALGGVGQNAIRQQIARKIGEQTKEKKFGGPKAAENALGAFQAFEEDDDSGREKFLKDLKKNQLAVYAQLVDNAEVQGLMESKRMDVDTNGKALRAQDIIESNSSKLEAEDIPAVMKLAKQRGFTPGENFNYRRDALLNDKNSVSKMMDASDAAGKSELKQRLDELKKEALQLESQKAQVTAEAGVLAAERLEAEREDRARATRGRPPPSGGGGTPPSGGTPPAGGGPAPVPPRPGPGGGGTPPVPPAPAARPVRPSARPIPTRPAPVPPAGGSPPTSAPPTARGSNRPSAATGPRQIPVVVTVNGTPRGTISVEDGAPESSVLQAAKGNPGVSQYLQGKVIQRTTYLPGRLNIITN